MVDGCWLSFGLFDGVGGLHWADLVSCYLLDGSLSGLEALGYVRVIARRANWTIKPSSSNKQEHTQD